MRKIAHISDLHFGCLAHQTLAPLRKSIIAATPDLVVVSGDLTQRARAKEFQAARTFLDTLPRPQIVVPGNHDIPLYNVMARWLWPLHGFKQHVESNLTPFFSDGEVAVVGLNTARSLTIKGGRLNQGQVGAACDLMHRSRAADMRILVTHHPFDVLLPDKAGDIVGRAQMAMAEFARCGIDLILGGHMHHGHVGHASARYGAQSRILLIQAGTATSSRRRAEPNAWNLITLERQTAVLDTMVWRPGDAAFRRERSEGFRLAPQGWQALTPAGLPDGGLEP